MRNVPPAGTTSSHNEHNERQAMDTAPGPTPPFDYTHIPHQLKEYRQFVLWRYGTAVSKDGTTKLTKIPMSPHTSTYASVSDPRTWGTLDDCIHALPTALEEWQREDPQARGGIGFVFTASDPYCGIDFDHCYATLDADLDEALKVTIRGLHSYTEVSPSQTGLHVICEATLPPGRRRKGQIELYEEGRFFTLTGWRIDELPADIVPSQAAVTQLWCELFAPPVGTAVWCLDEDGAIVNAHPVVIERVDYTAMGEPYAIFAETDTGWPLTRCEEAPATSAEATVVEEPEPAVSSSAFTPDPPQPSRPMSDSEVLDKVLHMSIGHKTRALYHGDTSAYEDNPSRADMALCQYLAFYTQDADQIDRIFRTSGLMRPKWDVVHFRSLQGGETYGHHTIAVAIAQQKTTYQGRRPSPVPDVPPPVVSVPTSNGTTQAPQAPASMPASWRDELAKNKEGIVLQTLDNCLLAIPNLEPWKSEGCWYDVVRDRYMVGRVPVGPGDDTHVGAVLGRETGMRVTNIALMGKALDEVCRQTPRDLLMEWVDTLPYTPVTSLLTTWLRTYASVSASVPDGYVADLSRLIPVSMLSRIYAPGSQYRNVVIFEGDEDIGKSKITKALAGEDAYGQSWHVAISAGMESKEAHMMLQGAFVAELEELSSYSKTDENRMKAFVTMQTDAFIPKYSNKREDRPRRTIFLATVNPEGAGDYLKGQTGNTRYLPIEVGHVDVEGFMGVRTQLFAEAKTYLHGHTETWWQLDFLDEAMQERAHRRQTSVYEGTDLTYWLLGKSECTWQEVARDCFSIPPDRFNRVMHLEICKALRASGWESARTMHKRFWRPAPSAPPHK